MCARPALVVLAHPAERCSRLWLHFVESALRCLSETLMASLECGQFWMRSQVESQANFEVTLLRSDAPHLHILCGIIASNDCSHSTAFTQSGSSKVPFRLLRGSIRALGRLTGRALSVHALKAFHVFSMQVGGRQLRHCTHQPFTSAQPGSPVRLRCCLRIRQALFCTVRHHDHSMRVLCSM